MFWAFWFFLLLISIRDKETVTCFSAFLDFDLVTKNFAVEGFNNFLVEGHGDQLPTQKSTSTQSQSATQLALVSEGFHQPEPQPVEAALGHAQFTSFTRLAVDTPHRSSNGLFQKGAMEMFHLQKTGQRKRTILSGMWETLAGMRGFILCQQPSRDSSGRSFCGGQLSSPVAWEAQLFSESTPSPKQSSRSTERQHAERKGIERARTQRRFERERCFKRDEPATAWPLFGASTSSCPSRMGSGSGRYGLAYSTIFIDPCSGESSDGFGTLASGDTAQAGLGGAQTECRFSPPSDSGGCEGHQYQGEQTSDQGHAPSCHRIGQGTAAIGRSFVRQVPITCIVEAISSCKCAALERIYQKISRSGTSPPSNHCSSTGHTPCSTGGIQREAGSGGHHHSSRRRGGHGTTGCGYERRKCSSDQRGPSATHLIAAGAGKSSRSRPCGRAVQEAAQNEHYPRGASWRQGPRWRRWGLQAIFWLGSQYVTSEYICEKPPHCHGDFPGWEYQHSIMEESDFCSISEALSRAHILTFELGIPLFRVNSFNPSFARSFTKRHVGCPSFDESVTVLLGLDDDLAMGAVTISHDELSTWQEKPWALRSHDFDQELCHLEPLSEEAVLIRCAPLYSKCRLLDNWLEPTPADMHRDVPVPDPDVIPDPFHAPVFIRDLLTAADLAGVFTDLDDDAPFRVRTWYIHHQHHRRMTLSRTVELYEDWRTWERDLTSTWRDFIHPNEEIRYQIVTPDPYRGL